MRVVADTRRLEAATSALAVSLGLPSRAAASVMQVIDACSQALCQFSRFETDLCYVLLCGVMQVMPLLPRAPMLPPVRAAAAHVGGVVGSANQAVNAVLASSRETLGTLTDGLRRVRQLVESSPTCLIWQVLSYITHLPYMAGASAGR